MSRARVLLPDPTRPTTARVLPAGTRTSISRSTVRPSYAKEAPRNSISPLIARPPSLYRSAWGSSPSTDSMRSMEAMARWYSSTMRPMNIIGRLMRIR